MSKIPLSQCRGPGFDTWSGNWSIFPGGSDGKASACNVGDPGSIPGLGRSPGGGNGQPLTVFWPGEFHGLCSPWGSKDSDKTEQLSLPFLTGN